MLCYSTLLWRLGLKLKRARWYGNDNDDDVHEQILVSRCFESDPIQCGVVERRGEERRGEEREALSSLLFRGMI